MIFVYRLESLFFCLNNWFYYRIFFNVFCFQKKKVYCSSNIMHLAPILNSRKSKQKVYAKAIVIYNGERQVRKHLFDLNLNEYSKTEYECKV
jgi:hypothetical protein